MSLTDSPEDVQFTPEARAYAGPLPEGASIWDEAPKAEIRALPELPKAEAPAPDIPTARLRAALNVAQADNLDADRVARGIGIARNLGLPPRVVMADMEYARREEVARKIEANPLLANWAAKNEFNAAVAAGDAETLNTLFNAVQKEHERSLATRPDMGVGERVLTLLGEGTRDVAQGLDSFLVAAARSVGHETVVYDDDGNEEYVPGNESVQKWADYRQQQIADIELAAGPRLEAQTALGGYLQDVVRMIPQLAGQIAASVAGGPLAGMAFMGGQIAGSQYQGLIRKGVDDGRALAAGLVNAVIQAPLEQIGLGKIFNIFKTSGLKNIAKRTAEGVLTEGATEFLQSFPESATDLWAKLGQDEGASQWFSRFMAALPDTTKQGLYEAAVAAPFGLIGGMGKAAYDRARQKRAEAFRDGQVALHEQVEAVRASGTAPEMVEGALAAAGMDQVVGVDAEALETLHQDGRDLLTPLGLTPEDVEAAAAAGQDIHLPLARLHSRLNQEEITAIMPHVRQTPEALNAEEAAHVNEKIVADALKVAELFQDDAQLFADMKAERERLLTETVSAIREQPGLVAQAEASSGNVEAYVGDWLNMVQAYAWRMGASGQNPVEFLRKVTMDETRALRRAKMSQEEIIGEDLAGPEPEIVSQPKETQAAPAPIIHAGVETVEDLYSLAEAALPGFQESLTFIGAATGGTALFRPGSSLKSPERVRRKIEQDYPVEGAKRVLDVLGGTLLYESRAQVEAALPIIEEQVRAMGGEMVRVKNRFERPSAGYKDILLNIRMPNGMVTEVLMTTKAMSEAKMGENGIGHDIYEAMQAAASVWKDKRATDEERAEAWGYLVQLRRASQAYYDSTGEESNATASFSGIVEPLNIISATGASNAGSKLYPKIEPFLGNIRNRPEFATAYGASSYSTNSSMNTGSLDVPISQGVPSEASRPSLKAVRTGGEAAIPEPPFGENIILEAPQGNAAGATPRKIPGAETQILGKGTSEPARYEVWELADVIPSHDPGNSFARRPDYPASAQERPYHSDIGEQEKVRGNALAYQPGLVLNTNPTAENGPPIILRDGIVLGGNSRAMTLQLVYADNAGGAEAYRRELTEKAAQFGLDANAVAAMNQPVLVRVLESGMTAEEMAVKSRLYNQTSTQKLQAKAEGVSRARLLSAETLAELSADMAEFDSLRQFFDSPKSRGFVQSLLRDGVLEQTEIASLTDKKGLLNDQGKTLVENALRGLVVPDYDILAATPPAVLNKLDRIIPALARLKARGEGWDLSGVLVPALRLVGAAAKDNRKLEGWLGQVDLLDTDPDKKRPAVQALALTLANATQKEVLARFEAFAEASGRRQKGMGMLMAQPETAKPAPAFIKAFLRPVLSVDGKTLTDFDPAGNPRHAALLCAYEHGGKGRTVAQAMANLEKTMNAKKTPKEKKAEALEMLGRLADFSGAVAIYEPKLGQYFQYREGQQLWQGRTAKERLAEDVAAWERQIDELEKGTLNMRSEMTMLSQTPLVMQLVGAKNLPVKMSPGKLRKAIEKHGLSSDVLRKIPATLADPIMIFASATHAGDLVMMLDIRDSEQNGATVNVPIALSLTDSGGYEANIATTAFGRRKNSTGAPDNQWFVRQAENGNLLYKHIKKSRDWARTSGVQFPGAISRSTSAGKKVLTDADLVKLRAQYPTYYQTAPAVGSAAFKNWFGKSRVVGENGEPLVVYHGTGATVGDDFGFDYRFSGKNGSADGYGFYFTSDEDTAKDYQEKGGSLVKAFLSLQKPMPVKQKPFSKGVLKKILKRAVEREIEQFPEDVADYRDSFLSNYADTYEVSFDRALNEAVEMIFEADTALDQIAEIANASGNKRATAEAVRDVTGYDSVFANGYGDKGAEGGKIYVAWFPEQVKSVENKGSWNAADPRIFYQSQKPIEVSSAALGVPAGSDIREYIRAAKAYHDKLKQESENGKPVVQSELGKPVRFSKTGWRKNVNAGADSRKWMLFPYLREIIESSRLVRSEKPQGKHEGMKHVHWCENEVLIDGQPLTVGFTLLEDEKGNLFYNIAADTSETKKGRAPLTLPDSQSPDVEELHQDEISSGETTIATDSNSVNLHILHHGEGGKPGYRGSTKIYPESYLISLFKGADLSTLLHETGHVFFEEMERMVESGVADETLRRDYATMRDWLGAKAGVPLTVAQREQAARGFEAYLMEGKAPSENLASAFARFRRWLLKIYQSAVRLNAPLTDEVRGVFDRMISTEREIAATAARNELLDLTARELDALGITGQTRETAEGLMKRGREAAAEALEKARAENRKARLAKYTREAWTEVREMRVYKVRKGLRATPLDLNVVKEGYGEDIARDLLKKIPGSARNEDGMDPEIFAAEHGYENAAAMFEDVLAAPRQGDMVAELVRQKEAKHDAAYDALEQLMETKEVAIQMELVGRRLSDLLGVQSVAQEAYQRAAQAELAAMPMGRAVQTGNFLAAMRRALQQMRTALAAGDREKALLAQRRAQLNMEFARQSRQLARSREKLERAIKRFTGMKKGDPTARYMVMDMGYRHGLCTFNARLAEGRDAATAKAWIDAQEADGYAVFPDKEALFGPGKPWRAMSVTEFEGLADTVAQIVAQERNRRTLLTTIAKIDQDEAVRLVTTSLYENQHTHAVKSVESQPAAVRALKGLHAIHTKIEALCLALDGGKMGPVYELIYLPMSKADDRQALRFRKVKEDLNAPTLFGAYTRKELAQMGTKRELVEEIGERLTWENRIAVALNMGNAVNMERIRSGHGWTDEQIAAVLKPLTARDWNFVQAVWNYLDTFKEEAFQLEEDVNGLRPKAVEAQPFTVKTADGQTLHLAGGYYPIRYNPQKGVKAFAHSQKEMDKEIFGGRNYGAAMTRAGHLKARDEHGLGTPLLLELSVVTDHVFNVVHDLCFRKAVLDVAKIIRHPKVMKAFQETVGLEMYNQLMPWLQDVANEKQEPMHQIHRWARWARASTSIMQMGFKITTMLAQPMGITQSMELLGYRWTAVGVKQVYGKPWRIPELLQETYARSTFMANRMQSFDREVRDFAKQLKPGMGRFGWLQVLKDKAFVPMGVVQMGVDLPTWWGAYAKGVKDFAGDEVKAAQYADSIVRMSQGSGSTKDLARVQRGNELMRLFTMFYSYFNTFYQLGARRIAWLRDHHSPADIFRAANTALLLWFMPAVFGELLAGRGPGDDDDDWKWASMQILQYPFQTVVGIRDLANGIFGEFGYQITPAQSAPAAFVKWFTSVNKALKKEDPALLAKPTAEALGYAFSLPMKQPIITVGNLWNYLTGDDPDFAVRDLFFTKRKDRK